MTHQQAPDASSFRARIDALVADALDLAERSNLDARMNCAVKLVAEGPSHVQSHCPRLRLQVAGERSPCGSTVRPSDRTRGAPAAAPRVGARRAEATFTTGVEFLLAALTRRPFSPQETSKLQLLLKMSEGFAHGLARNLDQSLERAVHL
jgi:hypothetical protein